ncbi:MAG: M48 family metalloprotease [Alphaproteobacteria bacterium]|nr:M48 family metalloprotease [Alphaproteobacteria bacterium]MBU2270045.1 M48 family metalloprotease [Alphaproteobacteria bacterium]MBU2417888.1 M48 family metalloprotease [Alphaproteobacteria bacterium]
MKLHRQTPLALSLTCVLALGACSGGPSSVPLTTADLDAAARLTSLTDLDQRVARVAWRLSKANADLCPAVRPSAGWALHSARQYSLDLRPHVENRFGLVGDLPGVLAVPPGSPAAAAGFAPGDLIIDAAGAGLDPGDGDAAASWTGLERNLRVIDTALARGPTPFTVQRGDDRIQITVTPERACGYDVQLDPSDELNARADGRRLFISTALAGFARTDDELAVILGHELAHHVLRHHPWDDAGGAARRVNDGAWKADGGRGGAEQQADRAGLYLLARAGYDPAVAAPFWRRFGESNWRVRFPQIGHASAGSRAQALEAVEREIEAKRQAGGELLP